MALEVEDTQGVIFSAYPDMDFATYLLLTVKDAVAARAWAARLVTRVTHGAERRRDRCVNVAFSAQGLALLGVGEESLGTFAAEFVEGMTGTDKRSEIRGDLGDSAPKEWIWGNSSRSVHVLLMIHSTTEEDLEKAVLFECREFDGALGEAYRRSTVRLPDRREHFGFADGISQPEILELGKPRTPGVAQLRAGEFILGYPNQYGKLPFTPEMPASADRGDALRSNSRPDRRDLGRNGSYLVVRQIHQDVARFWSYMLEQAAGSDDQAVRFASKCIGRWPSGAPLALSPDKDDLALASSNDFLYATIDPAGERCPVSAHIRRANPRDSLDPTPKGSLDIANHHAIIRRGRSFGAPLGRFAEDDGAERGLFFMCVNANISRQFEFVQQTWINNAKFDGLYDDPDPILGERDERGGTFTIPEKPVRRRLRGMPAFTRVRGGGYFFLPSVRALKFLSKLGGACCVMVGCGMHLGPSAVVPTSGDRVLYGVSGGYSVYPSGGQGLALGGRGTLAFGAPGGPNRTEGWGSAQIGYGNRPVPDDSRVGVEVGLGPAVGDLASPNGHAFAMGWTTDLSLLYRVSPTERPWQLGTHAETYHMIVPSVEIAELVPIGEGHDHGLTTTFVFSLAYRFDEWLAVEP